MNFSNIFHLTLAVLAATVLTSCLSEESGSSSPPQQPVNQLFMEQVLDWKECSEAVKAQLFHDKSLDISDRFRDRLHCANMRAPLDHADYEKGEITVALMRVRSDNPAARLGSLFINPGGPGEDGLSQGALLAYQLSNANPDVQLGRTYLDFLDSYDFVGFSPRGLGDSTRFSCAGNGQVGAVYFNDRSTPSLSSIRQLDLAKMKADACQKGDLWKYINTDQTAADLHLARHLLGDEKLNMIGYSYGTWLATWYGSKYPEAMGRILLDSSMDFSASFDFAKINTEHGLQALFHDVYAPFAVSRADFFQLGATASEVAENLAGLRPYTRQLLRNIFVEARMDKQFDVKGFCIPDHLMDGFVYGCMDEVRKIDFFLETLKVALTWEDLMDYYAGDTATVSEAINTVAFFEDNRNYELHQAIAHWLTKRFESAFKGADAPIINEWPSSDAVFAAVTCNDLQGERDPEYWIELGDRFDRELPLSGGKITEQACIYWNRDAVRASEKPFLTNILLAAEMPLFVQSAHDMLTPLDGAINAARALGNKAGFITVRQESEHGLFPYKTECVDAPIINYFLTGVQPGSISCTGKPYAFFVDQTVSEAEAASAISPDNLYKDPHLTSKVNKLRSQVSRD